MTKELIRVRSGIPGLDTILCGGLVEGASYILQGSPGAGKTILANQFAFTRAKQGGKILYVTLLAESHDRLFQTLSTFDFYDASFVGKDIFYISLFQVLKDKGLPALVMSLREELARHQCSTLVLDGLLIAKDKAETALDVKTFVAELQSHAAFTGCTVLFLTSARIDEVSPEHTMVDGVIQLKEELLGIRTARRLRVSKSRGSAALGGLHEYEISGRGICVYPRLEAVHGRPSGVQAIAGHKMPTGVGGFDAVVGGGLPSESVTLLMGPSGSGKTTFGLNFLALATQREPGLYFGFYESPPRLFAKGHALGLDIEALARSNALGVLWSPMKENLVDQLGHQLLDAVRSRGIRRLFIDGFAGFHRAATYPARLTEFYTALSNELRALGVTTIATLEMRDLQSLSGTEPLPEYSSLMDNLVMMREVQLDGEFKRFVAVVKVRDGAFDPAFHHAAIGHGGLHLGARLSWSDSARDAMPGSISGTTSGATSSATSHASSSASGPQVQPPKRA